MGPVSIFSKSERPCYLFLNPSVYAESISYLTSRALFQLWRTGAFMERFTADEDDDIDVSYD